MQSINQKRENFRKQIRRQYIETFTKNKRKQFIEELSQKQNANNYGFKKQGKQNLEKIQNYFSTLNYETFLQQPNSHLQFMVEILSQSDTRIYRNKICEMLVIVHRYLVENFCKERAKVEFLRKILKQKHEMQRKQKHQQNKGKRSNHKDDEDIQIMTDLLTDVLVYNEVFFEPIYGSVQERGFFQQRFGENDQNNSLSNVKKLNLYLFLDFLTAVVYELTPEIFVASSKEKDQNQQQSQVAHKNTMSNGYGEFLQTNSQKYQNQKNSINFFQTNTKSSSTQDTFYINQLICILNDIYTMTFTLFKITLHFRYQLYILQKLSHQFYQLYTDLSFLQTNNVRLPTLWLDDERFFIKEQIRNNISTKCLQIIVNMTALVGMNPQIDSLVHQLMILQQIDSLAQDNGFTEQEITLLTNLYSNLVQEQITWFNQKHRQNIKNFKKKSIFANDADDSQIQQEYPDNEHVLRQPPGIYLDLLQKITQNVTTQEQFGLLVYILKVILQNYEVPSRQENIKIQQNHQYLKSQNTHLILSLYHAETIAQVFATLFNRLTISEPEIPQLANLYIQVIEKMVTYLLYLQQLSQILSMVIKNENKRMFHIHSKSHSPLKGSITSETDQKQKTIITQNIKRVLIKTTQLIVMLSEQVLTNKSRSMEISLDYAHETIPQDIINTVMVLWQQNQIEYCYTEFLGFIHTAVQYFPQHLILTDSKERNQHFLELIDQIPSDDSHANLSKFFISILEHTLCYVQNFQNDLKNKQSLTGSKYFRTFADKWMNILQHLQGLLYSQNEYKNKEFIQNSKFQESSSEKMHKRIEYLYDSIDGLLKSALENMQAEI